MELVGKLVEFMGYCCAGKGNKESSIVGKLVAISVYHKQLLGPSVSMSNPLIRLDRLGNVSIQHTYRWVVGMIDSQHAVDVGSADGDAGGRAGMGGRRGGAFNRSGIDFFMLQASVFVAKKERECHKVYGLRRGEIAFWRETEQEKSRINKPNNALLRFRGSNANHGIKEAALVSTRTGLERREERRAEGLFEWNYVSYVQRQVDGRCPLDVVLGEGWLGGMVKGTVNRTLEGGYR